MLVPRSGDAEERASFKRGSPKLEEEGQLADPLLDRECTKFDASKFLGAVDNYFRGISVVTTLWQDFSSSFALDRLKIGRLDISNGQRVSDARDVDGVIECPALVAVQRAASNDR
jgi:hypothetical protein